MSFHKHLFGNTSNFHFDMIPKLDKANARNICAYINVKFYTNSVKNVKYHENLWLCQIKIEAW